MDDIRFEWDLAKARENVRKHGVSFDEARTAIAEEQAILLDDPDHSSDEDRFALLGLSAPLRMLVVAHCYRSDGGVVRVISARKATRSERAQYDAQGQP